MLADVPLGAFLSGGGGFLDDRGADASLCIAPGQNLFEFGFDDPQYNEAGFAKAVAAHLGD